MPEVVQKEVQKEPKVEALPRAIQIEKNFNLNVVPPTIYSNVHAVAVTFNVGEVISDPALIKQIVNSRKDSIKVVNP